MRNAVRPPVKLLVSMGTCGIAAGTAEVLKAIRNIGRGQVFDENFLMVVATVGAFLLSAVPGVEEVMFPEAVAVMLFFQIGEWFEKRAVGRTRQSSQSAKPFVVPVQD